MAILFVDFKPEDSGVVLISGASTGIGKDAAFALAVHGFDVVFGIRKREDEKKVMDTFTGPPEAKARLHPVILDVTHPQQCQDAIDRAVHLAKVKNTEFVGLVNNAGASGSIGAVEWNTEKDLRELFDLNFFGATRLTAMAIPHFRARKAGRIIAISSVAGFFGLPFSSPYTATKFAMEGFYDSLRREVDPLGIAVSVISPGCTKSALTLHKNRELMEKLIPKNRTDPAYTNVLWLALAFENTCGLYGYEPAASTSLDILDAMTSRHPLTRYTPGIVFGLVPAYWLRLVLMITPDRVVDYLSSSTLLQSVFVPIYGKGIGTLS